MTSELSTDSREGRSHVQILEKRIPGTGNRGCKASLKLIKDAKHLSPNHTGDESQSQGWNPGLWTSEPGGQPHPWLLNAHHELCIRPGSLLRSKMWGMNGPQQGVLETTELGPEWGGVGGPAGSQNGSALLSTGVSCQSSGTAVRLSGFESPCPAYQVCSFFLINKMGGEPVPSS